MASSWTILTRPAKSLSALWISPPLRSLVCFCRKMQHWWLWISRWGGGAASVIAAAGRHFFLQVPVTFSQLKHRLYSGFIRKGRGGRVMVVSTSALDSCLPARQCLIRMTRRQLESQSWRLGVRMPDADIPLMASAATSADHADLMAV